MRLHVATLGWLLLASCTILVHANFNFMHPTEEELLMPFRGGYGRRLMPRQGSFQCPGEGFYADPADCSKFYRCVNYGGNYGVTAFEFKCSDGTVFDEAIIACNHPWAVHGPCGANMIGQSTMPQEIPSGPATGGSHSHQQPSQPPKNEWQPEPEPAPEPEPTSEDNNEIDGAGTGGAADPRPKCEQEGYFTDPNNCQKFYRCVSVDTAGNFDVYRFMCGPGTVFDEMRHVCAHPRDVMGKCGVTEAANEAEPGSEQQQGSMGENSEGVPAEQHQGEINGEQQQGSSMSENNEVSPEQQQPGGNNEAPPSGGEAPPSGGESPSNGGESPSNGGESPSNGGEAPSNGAQEPQGSAQNENTPQNSEEGNKENEAVPSEGSSNNETPAEGSGSNSEGGSNNCNKPEYVGECQSEGFFPVDGDCRKFYRCVTNGKPDSFSKYDFECGEGTIFDPDNNVCNHPSTVQRQCDNPEGASLTMEPGTGEQPAQSGQEPNQEGKPAEENPGQSGQEGATQSGNEQPGQEQPGQEQPGQEQPGQEQPGQEQPGQEQPGQEQPGQEQPGQEQPGQEQSGQEQPGQEQPGQEQPGQEQPNQPGQEGGEQPGQEGGEQPAEQGQPPMENNEQAGQPGENPPEGSGQQPGQENGSGEQPNNPPPQNSTEGDNCTAEGFYPVTGDCKKFYRCVDNGKGGFTKYVFDCAEGTLFDPELNICNHERDVQRDCSATNSDPGTTEQNNEDAATTTTAPAGGDKGESTTPPPEGDATTTTSPIEVPNEAPGVTSSPGQEPPAESQPSSPPASPPCIPVDPNPPVVNCTMEGYYPDPTNCSNFYRCVDFDGQNPGDKLSVYFFRCPTGSIYDPKKNTCDKPENIQPPRDCSGAESTTTPPEGSTEVPPPENETTESPAETTEAPGSETTPVPPESETTVAPEDQTTPPPESETTTLGVEETTPNMNQEPTTQEGNTKEPDVTTPPPEGTTEDTPMTTEVVPTTENTDMPETTPAEPGTTEMQQETTTGSVPPTEVIPTEGTTTGPTMAPPPPPPPANQTECDCCNTEPGQFSYVCPTTFRRDPRYCNRFYQCTKRDESDINVVFFNCPNGTIFDNKMQQCLFPDEAAPCSGETLKAPPPNSRARNFKPPVEVGQKALCPNTGFYSYEGDCQHFIACRENSQGDLKGMLKRCPDGFTFWDVSRRCEVSARIARRCSSRDRDMMAWRVPVDYANVGRLSKQLLMML